MLALAYERGGDYDPALPTSRRAVRLPVLVAAVLWAEEVERFE